MGAPPSSVEWSDRRWEEGSFRCCCLSDQNEGAVDQNEGGTCSYVEFYTTPDVLSREGDQNEGDALSPSLAPLGPTRSSHELTITCADVPVAVLAPVPSVAALATVVVLDKIIVRRQVHEAPSLQSPRQLMLLS